MSRQFFIANRVNSTVNRMFETRSFTGLVFMNVDVCQANSTTAGFVPIVAFFGKVTDGGLINFV